VAASAVSPPELDRIDLATGARSTVFDPNEGLRARSPRAEQLAWTAPDGQLFTGVLVLPGDGPRSRLPLFITFYRCEGFLRGGVGDEWPLQPLVAAGFAAACINSAPILGRYDPLATYRHALGAITAMVDRLERRGLIDRSRIGMGGLSFGSEVTMWTAIHSGLLAAASISSPQPEASYYWFNAVRGRDQPARVKETWGLGIPQETPRAWQRLAPALNTARIRAPLLLQLPEEEARYVIELYARLTNSPTPAELYVFPDEAHIKIQPRHKLAVYQRNFDWFRFWLQGHVDPDPAKAAQFARWEKLAERRRNAQPQSGHARSQSSMAASSSSRK
jgi:dipeptidyl aminopeptidase/acylaminoacyl peptidase